MQRINIIIGKIYKNSDKVDNKNKRMDRFSAFVHRHDKDLIEGNSARALNWAKSFRVR